MQISLFRAIQRQLLWHLEGNRELHDFRDWFAPLAWSIEDRGDEEAARLVYDIELAFAEYSSGMWTEEQQRRELRSLAKAKTISA